MEAGKKIKGDIGREATTSEVQDLRNENSHLNHLDANLSIKYDYAKKAYVA
jgi:transposase